MGFTTVIYTTDSEEGCNGELCRNGSFVIVKHDNRLKFCRTLEVELSDEV